MTAGLTLRTARLRAARKVVVATDVAVRADGGDVIAVEGPNGAGKTTLLAAAAGLLPAGRATVRPANVGYSPERASALPRLAVRPWLVELGCSAGLSRQAAGVAADSVLGRLGLDGAARTSLRALSRGNAQRALVAQALVASPDLLILDEPSGGLDADGVRRVSAEIGAAAGRGAVVLVARHPTAPLPLPPGVTWSLRDGTVSESPRDAAPQALLEVETGEGTVRRVTEADLPSVLRAALDAGIPVRRVQPISAPSAVSLTPAPAVCSASATRRAGAVSRVLYGAVHRTHLLTASQWFAAPGLAFLVALGAIYATDAGPALQAAAVTALVLAPLMTWLTVLAHRADGRELARAFAAHVGGRGRAHLAASIGVFPFAVAFTVVAVLVPLVSQGEHPHPGSVVASTAAMHLGAAVLGIGIGAVLAPPLMERNGWRLIVAVALYLVLFAVRGTPMTPLIDTATHPSTSVGAVALATAVLSGSGLVMTGAAAWLGARLIPSA